MYSIEYYEAVINDMNITDNQNKKAMKNTDRTMNKEHFFAVLDIDGLGSVNIKDVIKADNRRKAETTAHEMGYIFEFEVLYEAGRKNARFSVYNLIEGSYATENEAWGR